MARIVGEYLYIELVSMAMEIASAREGTMYYLSLLLGVGSLK